MPIAAAGVPLKRLKRSCVRALNSTRATSFMRITEPSGLARRTMAANSSGRVSRPVVLILIWTCCSLVIGAAPTRPSAAWMFWLCTDEMTSFGVRLSSVSRSGSSQLVNDVDRRIVAQVNGIVGIVRGIDVYHLEQGGGFLADGQAGARYFLG